MKVTISIRIETMTDVMENLINAVKIKAPSWPFLLTNERYLEISSFQANI